MSSPPKLAEEVWANLDLRPATFTAAATLENGLRTFVDKRTS